MPNLSLPPAPLRPRQHKLAWGCFLFFILHALFLGGLFSIIPFYQDIFMDVLGRDAYLPLVTRLFFSWERVIFIIPSLYFLACIIDIFRFGQEESQAVKLIICMSLYPVALVPLFVLAMFSPIV